MRINDNNDRAARAMRAVEAYKANDWRGRRGTNGPDGDEVLEAIGDLLGDLHHLADRTPPADALERAADALAGRNLRWDCLTDKGDFHYREEVAEEGLEARGVTSWTMGEAEAKLAALEDAPGVCRHCGEPIRLMLGKDKKVVWVHPREGYKHGGGWVMCRDQHENLAELVEGDPWEQREILRLTEKTINGHIHGNVPPEFVAEYVTKNAHRITEAHFDAMMEIQRELLEAWTDARVAQAETRRENGE